MIVRYLSNTADNGELVLTNINHLEKEDEETLAWISIKPHYVTMLFAHEHGIEVYHVAKSILLDFPAPGTNEKYTFGGEIYFCH